MHRDVDRGGSGWFKAAPGRGIQRRSQVKDCQGMSGECESEYHTHKAVEDAMCF